MSQGADRNDQRDVFDAESGLEALRRSPEFRGPVDLPSDHDHGDSESNDHLASIYDDREEQFDAAIPFVRQGLERGEQCLYVADDNSREEVRAAMRERGIDVDAALESGALSILTKSDTYLRSGEFDKDAMMAFWESALEEAKDEDGYDGLRAAAEMTWALDEETDLDLLVEYEAILNDLFSGEEYVVLCQYNRERFPAEVVRDVVRTHPHLISDSWVYRNVYYTPPEEFFAPLDPEREVDRMMETLRERTEVKTELNERKRYLREQYEIAADPDRTFDEKLRALFELGCDRFDLDYGGIARIDPKTDVFEVEAISGDHEHLVPGRQYPLSETYCKLVTNDGETAAVTDPASRGFEGKLCYEKFGVRTYLGTHLELDNDFDRTFFFLSNEPREEPFSDAERTFHRLMGEWVRKELGRKRREEQLQRKNDRLENFASMLAHELRNPVTIGQIYSQQLPGETDAEAVEYVTEAFDRIEDMIDVMLVLTRGREALGECSSVELATVVREAWDEVDTDDATLDVETDDVIRADETYVRHLFRNLFENAIQHGGSDVTVTVGELPTGFYVEDDGAGIPADERDAVFDTGYTTASGNGGTGLGLAFVHELADVYEWTCDVTESDASGARFEFRSVGGDSSGT